MGCPCANPPGSSKIRPIPRRPKVVKNTNEATLENNETDTSIEKQSSRMMSRKKFLETRVITKMSTKNYARMVLPGFVNYNQIVSRK